jgi:hypothetical protein
VIEFEDPTVLFHTGYVICTKATNQGVNFRNAIKNGFDIIMRDVHPGEEDFYKHISNVATDQVFDVKYVLADHSNKCK